MKGHIMKKKMNRKRNEYKDKGIATRKHRRKRRGGEVGWMLQENMEEKR